MLDSLNKRDYENSNHSQHANGSNQRLTQESI